MMRILAVLALCVGALVTSRVDAADLPRRLGAIPHTLTLTNQAIRAEIVGDGLRLTSAKGTDLYSPAKGKRNHSAPRVTFSPQGDFILSARVARPHGADYEGGALVVHAGPDRWIKLMFERLNANANAVTSSVAAPVNDRSYHLRIAPDVPATWLKIVRVGPSIRLYHSADGADWQILRDVPFGETRQISVGFASQSPTGERFEADFSDIRFEARRSDDYWAGR